eukprot:3468123-Pyramimonas_sp.AAC.1
MAKRLSFSLVCNSLWFATLAREDSIQSFVRIRCVDTSEVVPKEWATDLPPWRPRNGQGPSSAPPAVGSVSLR